MNPRPFLFGALFLLAACAKPASPEAHGDSADHAEKEPFGRMSVEELDAKMKAAQAGAVKLAVYDNNGRDRFDKGHIPGAKWVSFDHVQASDLPAEKDATLVFYCANEH